MVAVILAVFVLFKVLPGAAVPILVAMALAYALDPVVDRLEARGLSRTVGILLLFFMATLAFAGFMLYLVPALGSELGKMPEFIAKLTETTVPRVEKLVGRSMPNTLREATAALGSEGSALAQKALPGVVSFLWGAIGGTASFIATLFALLVIPVLSFFLLRDYDEIVAWARGLIPRRYETLVAGRFSELDGVLSAFIRGQLTVGAILTCIYALGLTIAGLDLAVVIGGITGFGVMIPYIGPAIGITLAVFSLLVSWQGPWQLVVAAITFGLGQSLEPLVLTPRIVGGKVGLSAFSVMAAILVCGSMFGFLGVLLAVPVTATMKVVVRVLLFRYKRSRLYEGQP